MSSSSNHTKYFSISLKYLYFLLLKKLGFFASRERKKERFFFFKVFEILRERLRAIHFIKIIGIWSAICVHPWHLKLNLQKYFNWLRTFFLDNLFYHLCLRGCVKKIMLIKKEFSSYLILFVSIYVILFNVIFAIYWLVNEKRKRMGDNRANDFLFSNNCYFGHIK